MEKSNMRLLYSGTSLETYLRIKNQLDNGGIEYVVTEKKNDNWFKFILQLTVIGTGSRGMNREREAQYDIYVSDGDYERAAVLIDTLK